jgi:RecA/RadA recombinase
MAKKNVEKSKSPSSFLELNDVLNKISPDGGLIEDTVYTRIDEWIPTGSYILNACISGSLFGGMPNRRSLMVAGPPSAGKTYLAMSICRSAQAMEYTPIYVDTEGAIDIEFIKRLGIDPARFRVEPINTIEKFKFFAANLNKYMNEQREAGKTPPKIILVLDSLGNLSSEKEKNDAQESNDKRDMTKQQGVRGMFRVNGLDFALNGIPFIILAQSYDKIGSYIPGQEIGGGGGAKYNASITLMLTISKMDDKDSEDQNKKANINSTKVGVVVTVTPVKQRFARPIKVQFHIPFYKKPNPYVGLESFVSWDICGIMRGKVISEKEYSKLKPEEQKECREFEVTSEGKKGKEITKMYALPKDTARTLVCKHLGGEVPLVELFTDKVFTQDVLQQLDNNAIKPIFMLPSIHSLDDLVEITEELEGEEISVEEITEDKIEE